MVSKRIKNNREYPQGKKASDVKLEMANVKKRIKIKTMLNFRPNIADNLASSVSRSASGSELPLMLMLFEMSRTYSNVVFFTSIYMPVY